jgi:hypothetical protein
MFNLSMLRMQSLIMYNSDTDTDTIHGTSHQLCTIYSLSVLQWLLKMYMFWNIIKLVWKNMFLIIFPQH